MTTCPICASPYRPVYAKAVCKKCYDALNQYQQRGNHGGRVLRYVIALRRAVAARVGLEGMLASLGPMQPIRDDLSEYRAYPKK